MTRPTPAHRIALLAFPGIQAFDVSVITEVRGRTAPTAECPKLRRSDK